MFSLAILSAAILSQPKTLTVQVAPAAIKEARSWIKGLGTITSVDPKTGELTVKLAPGVTPQRAAASLWPHRMVEDIRGAGVSIQYWNAYQRVSTLKKVAPKMEGPITKNGRLVAQEDESGAPDYLNSLLYFRKVRAFPFDRVDWSAYPRAVEHALHMAPAHFGGGNTDAQASAIHIGQATLGGKWEFIGPRNLDVPYRTYYGVRPTSGRINAVAYDPNSATTYYLGGAQGGLWKTTDSGVNWTPLGDAWPAITVSSIAVDPKNSKVIYVGTGDFQGGNGLQHGIEKSTDGGVTWTNLGYGSFGNTAISGILIDPSNSSTITASSGNGADGFGFVWRSTDGGISWTKVLTTAAQWTGLTRGVSSMYTASGGGGKGLVYRSDDGGATWNSVTSPVTGSNPSQIYVAASQVDASTVYAMDPADQKIFKSTDKGSTWSDITGNLNSGADWNQSWYDYYIQCFAKNGADDLMVGLIDISESTDGGTTWKLVGNTESGGAITHNDQHSFAPNPKNPDEFLFGNDGGVYRATRSGSSWTVAALSKTLGVTQFYNVRNDMNLATAVIGGSQDNATPVSTGDLANWANVAGGDGGYVAIDPTNTKVQYGTIYGFNIIQTTDGWQTQNGISPGLTANDTWPFVSHIFNDPTNGDTLYGATNYLYKYSLSANSWQTHVGGKELANGGLVNAFAVAPSNGQVLYTGSDSGLLYVSRDGGSSWTLINGSGTSLPARSIQWISVDPTNPNAILVALSGSGSGHLYLCANTQGSTPVFANVSGGGSTGLPDISANSVDRDPKKPGTVWFVGTDIGVFATSDSGQTWQNATVPLGLPQVQVTSVQVTKFGYLYAGTYGRGIWRIKLGADNFYNPNSYQVIVGQQISGSLPSLYADDGNMLNLSAANQTKFGLVSQVQVNWRGPLITTPSGLGVSIGSLSSTSTTAQVFILDLKTNSYVLLGTVHDSPLLGDQTLFIQGNPADYIGPKGVFVMVRDFTPLHQISGSFSFSIDHITLDVQN